MSDSLHHKIKALKYLLASQTRLLCQVDRMAHLYMHVNMPKYLILLYIVALFNLNTQTYILSESPVLFCQ